MKHFVEMSQLKTAYVRKEKERLDPFLWLRYPEDGIDGNIKRTLTGMRRCVVAVLLAAFLLFAVLTIAYNARPSLSALLVRPSAEEGTRVLNLHLKLTEGAESAEGDVNVEVVPQDYTEDPAENEELHNESRLSDLSRKFVSAASENTEGDSLVLPKELEGVSAEWSLPVESPPYAILALGAAVAVMVCFNGVSPVVNSLKKKSSEFEAELPSMILQLILLLNAGLVVSAAFDELLDQNLENDNPLYKVMLDIRQKSRDSNLPFTTQLYLYSQNCPVKSFNRFVNLVYENVNTGSELSGKLERDRESMWNSRLNSAKAKAGEADTKLCFPLMLLLIALVVICISPALMGL